MEIILNSKSKSSSTDSTTTTATTKPVSYVKNANALANASGSGARYSGGRDHVHNNAGDAVQKSPSTAMTIKKSSSMTNSSLSINNVPSNHFQTTPGTVKRVNSNLDMNNLVDQRKLNGSLLSLGQIRKKTIIK